MWHMLSLILLLVCNIAQGAEFSASVIAVLDGDTLLVQAGPFQAKVRLVNIDAPEKAQPFGDKALASLQSLVGGKEVQIESRAADQYGRTLALVSVGGMNVNQEQVRRGMAWAYSRSREAKSYVALQGEAQLARRGLWQQADPVMPSRWRKLHPLDASMHAQPKKPSARGGSQSANHKQFAALTCGKKRYCSQMATCDEAHYYLTVCSETRPDPDGDGVPCESLCVGMK
jgi:endonuclease YncB( thermonuclease family)